MSPPNHYFSLFVFKDYHYPWPLTTWMSFACFLNKKGTNRIYFFVSGFFWSTVCLWDPSMPLHITVVCSFSLLYSSSLCDYTIYLFFYCWFWVVSSFWLCKKHVAMNILAVVFWENICIPRWSRISNRYVTDCALFNTCLEV